MREKRRKGRVTTEISVEDEIAHLRGLDLKRYDREVMLAAHHWACLDALRLTRPYRALPSLALSGLKN